MDSGAGIIPRAIALLALIATLSAAAATDQTATDQTATVAESAATALQILQQLQFPPQQKRGFIEQQFNPMLKTPVESRGTLWVDADQSMVMELSHPRPEQRRLRGAKLSLSRPRLRTGDDQSVLDFSRVNHQLTLKPNKPAHLILLAAGALLQGDHQWITEHFELSFAARESGWEILLVPDREPLREQLPWIRLTGTATTLSGLRADRGSEGWQELAFFDPAVDTR